MKPLLFELLSTRKSWLAQRHAVLTRNVANADTPGYRPLDLKPGSFQELLARRGTAPLVLVRTAGPHLAAAAADPASPRPRPAESFEIAPDGNGVVLDQQLQKLAETHLGFELVTNLYRRQVGLLKTALGTAQG